MALYESGQMYLEAIFVLSKKNEKIRAIDVGAYLGYSKPSVSRAVSLLKGDGYLVMERDGRLELTERGAEIARNIYERHRFLTHWLMALGVPEALAEEDACKIEHNISEETFQCLKRHTEEMAALLRDRPST